MDYKSVFTNLCLELQQNRSWIKGLGKNPFTHSIPFTHSLTAVPFVRGHRSVFPGTPRNDRQSKKKLRVYTASEAKGLIYLFLLITEINRLEAGITQPPKYLDIITDKPLKLEVRVLIPVDEHPKVCTIGTKMLTIHWSHWGAMLLLLNHTLQCWWGLAPYVCAFEIYTQAWYFVLERARRFFLGKGHLYEEFVHFYWDFWKGTKAKTRGNGGNCLRCLR